MNKELIATYIAVAIVAVAVYTFTVFIPSCIFWWTKTLF